MPVVAMWQRSANDAIGVGTGFPVWRDQTYWLALYGRELDSTSGNEDAGMLLWELSEANGWGLGANTERTLKSASYSGAGTAEITYEIRRMPLPDLEPTLLTVGQPQGSGASQEICARVANRGPHAAPGYQVAFRMGTTLLPNGLANRAEGLQAGATTTVCVATQLPQSAGTSTLSVSVDEAHSIAEINEHNNRYESGVVTTPPAPTEADLMVDMVSVWGKEPLSDCDPGKNTVVVRVKNGGSKASGPFAVRVVLDDDDTDEDTVPGLDAGKTVDVTFNKVRFKKGNHEIQAQADARSAIAESNEINNTKTVTVTCRDQDAPPHKI